MSKEDILKELYKEKENLLNNISMIENLEVKPVTEKEWHKICETPARYNDILLEIAKITFPYGTDFKRSSNYITFNLNNFIINVPTYRGYVLEIDTSWFKFNALEKYKIQTKNVFMREYIKLVDNNIKDWYKLAKLRYPHISSKKDLFFMWWLRGKWKKVDIEAWRKEFKLEDKRNIDNYLECKKKKFETISNMRKFVDAVNILEQWAKIKYINSREGNLDFKKTFETILIKYS